MIGHSVGNILDYANIYVIYGKNNYKYVKGKTSYGSSWRVKVMLKYI